MRIKLLLPYVILLGIFGFPRSVSAVTTINSLSDVNRDLIINTLDLDIVGFYYGTSNPTGSAALADVNQSNYVGVDDMTRIGSLAGKLTSTCQIADVDNDSDVDSTDLSILQSNLGLTLDSTNTKSDLDGSGSITADDVTILNSVFGCSWVTAELQNVPGSFPTSDLAFSGVSSSVTSGTEGIISHVDYMFDGGGWNSSGVTATDGAFNSYLEYFSLTLGVDVSDGTHTLIVRASTATGQLSPQKLYSFSIDTIPPYFVPMEGGDVTNIPSDSPLPNVPFTIETKPEDLTSGTTEVRFYIDTDLICTDETPDSDGIYTCSVDFSGFNAGKHILSILAYDEAGNFTEYTKEIDVFNQLPETGAAILPFFMAAIAAIVTTVAIGLPRHSTVSHKKKSQTPDSQAVRYNADTT